MPELAVKLTLSSKKEVILRKLKIKHQNLAIQAVGKKAGDNQLLAGSLMQQELIKILVMQIDGKPVDAKTIEDLDSVFDYGEYQEILFAVNKMSGGGESSAGEPVTEIVSIGK